MSARTSEGQALRHLLDCIRGVLDLPPLYRKEKPTPVQSLEPGGLYVGEFIDEAALLDFAQADGRGNAAAPRVRRTTMAIVYGEGWEDALRKPVREESTP